MLAETINRFVGDETGATAIEYGLIAALIAMALITTFVSFGNSLVNLMGVGAGGPADAMAAATAAVNN